MGRLIVQCTASGLSVPAEDLASAGVEPGALVELIPLPGAPEILHRAYRYVAEKLGTGLGLSEPRFDGERWTVTLASSDGEQQVGVLFLDSHGRVDEAQSAGYEPVRGLSGAARTSRPAA